MRPSAAHACCLILALAGCGGPSASRPEPPHDGAMFPLPDGLGFFELKVERGAQSPRAPRGKAAKGSLVAFFYGPDGATELAPAPADVTVKLGGAESSQVVPLPARPASGADKAGRFASEPGNYPAGIRGTLAATVGGRPVEAPFLIR